MLHRSNQGEFFEYIRLAELDYVGGSRAARRIAMAHAKSPGTAV